MELSIPPPFSDPSSVPPNTPAASAEIKTDSAAGFKFPVEEIIKGLDQVFNRHDLVIQGAWPDNQTAWPSNSVAWPGK